LFSAISLPTRIAVCVNTVVSVGAEMFYQKCKRIKPDEVHTTPNASLQAQAR